MSEHQISDRRNERSGTEAARIVTLPALRVAAATGFGPEPEGLAWKALLGWMERAGLAVDTSRFFGFNDPNPSPGTSNYGYEQWVVLPAGFAETTDGKEVAFKDFPGGKYAVIRHRGHPMELPRTWAALRLWVEASKYRPSGGQWLEEALDPGLSLEKEPDWSLASFDLYFPVESE